jgi:hypothetical protein
MAAIYFAKLAGLKSDYFEPACGGMTDTFGEKNANRAVYLGLSPINPPLGDKKTAARPQVIHILP